MSDSIPDLPPPPAGYAQRMPRFEEADEDTLQNIGRDVFGRPNQLAPAAASAWKKMKQASNEENIRLRLISGFRSVSRQTEIILKKIDSGVPMEQILLDNAYPGHSEHHTGRAVDIGAIGYAHLSAEFANSAEFSWLVKHAKEYGYTLSYPKGNSQGIAFEPWHWCFQSKS